MKVAPGVLAVMALAGACSDTADHAGATCVLVDTSGSYVDEVKPAIQLVKLWALPSLNTGDTLVVARIDGESFDKANVVAVATMDPRPSRANAQKLMMAQALDAFAQDVQRARYTDIRGGVQLCADYLKEVPAGRRTVLVLSDMQEDLPPGVHRQWAANELEGMYVVALNVKRLRKDQADPATYRERLAQWDQAVQQAGGAGWRVVQDVAHLPALRPED